MSVCKIILFTIATFFVLSLLPFFKVTISGGYSFWFRHPELKKMDKMPGVWAYTHKRVNVWVYLDAKRKGMIWLNTARQSKKLDNI